MFNWLKHAFAVEAAGPAIPSSSQAAAVDAICREIVRRQMTLPAQMVLESSAPLHFFDTSAAQSRRRPSPRKPPQGSHYGNPSDGSAKGKSSTAAVTQQVHFSFASLNQAGVRQATLGIGCLECSIFLLFFALSSSSFPTTTNHAHKLLFCNKQ